MSIQFLSASYPRYAVAAAVVFAILSLLRLPPLIQNKQRNTAIPNGYELMNDVRANDSRSRSISIRLQFLVFATAGILHFVRPAPFVRIVPAWISWALVAVYLSGAAELAGAIGLLIPKLRVAAGWGIIALLIAVFPANVHMLQLARADTHAATLYVALLWARLPLQPLLIWWVWRAAVAQR